MPAGSGSPILANVWRAAESTIFSPTSSAGAGSCPTNATVIDAYRSSARPRQSKPAPRLALVAGTRTVIAVGCMKAEHRQPPPHAVAPGPVPGHGPQTFRSADGLDLGPPGTSGSGVPASAGTPAPLAV